MTLIREDSAVPAAQEAERLLSSASPSPFWNLVDHLWARRKMITLWTLGGMGVILVAVLLLPNLYDSTVRLMPPDSSSSTSSALARMATMGAVPGGLMATDLFGMKSSGSLFIGVLQSRNVQDRIVNRFNLREVYDVDLQLEARSELSAHTSISEDRKTGILTIKVSDRDPQRAAKIAEAYVQELNHVTSNVNTSAATKEREFLEARLVSVKRELDQAASALSAFSSRNATTDLREQGKATFEAIARLQGELILAEAELQSLRQIYASGSVRLKVAEARVNELSKQMSRLSGSARPLSNGGGQEEKNFPSLRELPALGVAYADLYRRARTLEIVLETLTKQYELAKVDEAKNMPSVRVLDSADVPERKAWPPRALFLAIGALIWFLGVVSWLLLRLAWEQALPGDPFRNFAGRVFTEILVWKRRMTSNRRLRLAVYKGEDA